MQQYIISFLNENRKGYIKQIKAHFNDIQIITPIETEKGVVKSLYYTNKKILENTTFPCIIFEDDCVLFNGFNLEKAINLSKEYHEYDIIKLSPGIYGSEGVIYNRFPKQLFDNEINHYDLMIYDYPHRKYLNFCGQYMISEQDKINNFYLKKYEN